MVSFDDEDDNGANSASDNNDDGDEIMDDVDDGDGDGDNDMDVNEQDDEGDGEDDDNEDDDGEEGDGDGDGDGEREGDADGDGEGDGDKTHDGEAAQQDGLKGANTDGPLANGTKVNGIHPSVKTLSYRPALLPQALTASVYDIVPTIAAPQGTSINTVTATPDMRWVFSGGSDGYIRKFNWPETVNSKLMLTVAQRHPFVDSVVKAGVLLSYWENEDATQRLRTPPPYGIDEQIPNTPVYSLAVQHQGLWLLSGGESGGINLQSVRHSEGTRITTLRKHTSAVSVLCLAEDERSVLSGSWDKTIVDWDLDAGTERRVFGGSAGQISTIEPRPLSTLPVPKELGERQKPSATFSSNNASQPRPNDTSSNVQNVQQEPTINGRTSDVLDAAGELDTQDNASDMGSLFGDDDDAMGGAPFLTFAGDEADASNAPMPGLDDDDDFSRAIASDVQEAKDERVEAIEQSEGDKLLSATDAMLVEKDSSVTQVSASNGAGKLEKAVDVSGEPTDPAATSQNTATSATGSTDIVNGDSLPHSEEPSVAPASDTSSPPTSPDTFLDAAIDGTIRIWDRRSATPVARILPKSSSPWCMNACWSPDGNSIYAGRRNGTVDEYNLHKGFREGAERVFKFPGGSGPVSAVKAMPNGRHLICASYDILRLYDLKDAQDSRHSSVPFLIVPGHRTGTISQLYVDPTCQFLISAAGNRGWDGSSTEVLLGYEIGFG